MWLVDLAQTLLELQASSCMEPPPWMGDQSDPLRATTFSAITAAFATQGYWVQADILDKLLFSDMQLWAPLVYVLAVIGGLVGVAIGSPPRNYMWFFMGPAIYSWLIGTTIDVKGVRWALPCVGDEQVLNAFQQKVWELSEIGLANSVTARRLGVTAAGISRNTEPLARISVSHVFLWFDELLSSTMMKLMRWTGLYNLESRTGGGDNTNIPELPDLSSEGLSSGVIWSLYADTKWQALEEITAASVDNPDFRDAFAHFFTVCGDALRGEYDNSAMMIAAASKGRQIPQTVIKCDGMAPGTCGGSSRSYEWARGSLAQTMVSQPSSLKNILGNSFSSLQGSFGSYAADFVSRDVLSCEDYLFFMMQGLRLEAAFKYEGLYRSTVPDMLPMNRISVDPESTLISTLFYGWDIREGRDWSDPYTESSAGTLLDLEQRRRFAYQLILLHLFRNEYMLVKEIAPLRQSNTEKTQQNTELVLKTTSAKSKFSELYTWSLMLPYLQGTLLYFLAIAYPFACILVVVPGWHKAVFTWMSFWAWAKMWDLGFALVKALERSIWAMTSFGGNVKYLSDRIVDVDERVGRPLTACSGDPMCPVPLVTLIEESINSGTYEDISNKTWYLFDQALLMTRALNLDLANSYYIYIMAGLYMSIPAVTGQIVLGARAGAASMVNSMIGGVASDAGRGASSAYQGDTSMKLRSNAGTIAQGSEALAMAKQGFAGQALGYAVKGLEEGRAGQEAQAGISGLSRINGQLQSSKDAKSVDARALAISGNGLADFGAAGGKAYASRQAAKAGQLPGPQGQQRGNGGEDAPGGWMGMAQAGTKGAFSAGEAWYMADVTDDYNQANRGISAQQAGLENRAFEANANSAQLRQAEGNMRSFADFSAKEAAWQTRNAFANQVGGWSAALGIQTGNVDPGSKPTDMVGFAMSGRLMKGDGSNEAGKHAWHLDWNTAGGHKQGTSDATAALNGRYGPDAVNNSYLGGFNGWGGVGGNAADHSVVKAGIQGGVNAMTSSSSDKPPRSSQ